MWEDIIKVQISQTRQKLRSDNNPLPDDDDEDCFQKSEIGDMKWLTFEQCMEKIRCYNSEKINMLKKINNILNNSNIV